MEKLFNDSELFQKERPKKITEEQEKKIYKELAQEILDNGWCKDDIEDIVSDLKKLSKNDSGYEMAKDLEGYNMNCSYDIDTDFIYWLDDFDYQFRKELEKNIKDWVQAHDIKPKFEKGTKLLITEYLCYKKGKGLIVYVNGFTDYGCYLIDEDFNRNGGTVLAYELVESCCEVI